MAWSKECTDYFKKKIGYKPDISIWQRNYTETMPDGQESMPVDLFWTKSICEDALSPMREVQRSISQKLMKKNLAVSSLSVEDDPNEETSPTNDAGSEDQVENLDLESNNEDDVVKKWLPATFELEDFHGCPKSITNMGQIFVLPEKNKLQYRSIVKSLNQMVNLEQEDAGKPKWIAGEAVIALLEHKNQWQRAQVISEYDLHTVYVCFVDIGQIGKISKRNVRIAREFGHTPILTVRVVLNDIAPSKTKFGSKVEWTEDALDKIHFSILQKRTSMYFKIQDRVTSFPIPVQASFKKKTDEWIDLSNLLISWELAVKRKNPMNLSAKHLLLDGFNIDGICIDSKQPSTTLDFYTASSSIPGADFPQRMHDMVPDQPYSVDVLSSVDSEVHVRLGSEKEDFESMMRKLQLQTDLPVKPQKGLPVAARFEDGRYYRAIVENEGDTLIRVRYVDFGDCQLVKPCQLRQLSSYFMNIPKYAVKIKVGSFSGREIEQVILS